MENVDITPFFSIIIPAYNEEKLIERCLKAVFNQNFPKDQYEIIVVDNASTDKTPDLIKKFPVISLFEPKKGLIQARSTGLKKARGVYIINLDADVQVPPDWLKRIYAPLQKNPRIALLTGPYKCVDDPKKFDRHNYIFGLLMDFANKILKTLFVYYGGNVVIKRQLFLDIGGYDLRYTTDQVSIINRLKKAGGEIYFDRKLQVLTSPRRTQGRVIKFIFQDIIVMYLFHNLYTKLTGKNLGNWEDIR